MKVNVYLLITMKSEPDKTKGNSYIYIHVVMTKIFHRSDKAITLKLCSRSPHTLYTKVLCRWTARLGQRERNNSWNKVYDLTFDPENWFMVIAHPNAFCGWSKSQIGPTGKKICSEKWCWTNKQTNKQTSWSLWVPHSAGP